MVVTLRNAVPADAERLNDALARLSADLGDRHRATPEMLVRAGWGPGAVFRAMLAETAQGDIAGVALYSPCFSTRRGGAGIYVSDLWAAPDQRGRALGRRLLAAALEDGAKVWGAGYIRLSVYAGSDRARRFYDRLGFRPLEGVQDMMLDAAGCAALKGET